MADDLRQRDGVGRIAAELCLVDVQPHAKHAILNVSVSDGSLDQCSADFAVVPINIVGPFQ